MPQSRTRDFASSCRRVPTPVQSQLRPGSTPLSWRNGPVVRDLWEANRGQFRISEVEGGNAAVLDDIQNETVNRVIDFYGAKDAQWLSDLTHMEDPWADSFAQRQNAEITPQAMSEYYSSIAPSE